MSARNHKFCRLYLSTIAREVEEKVSHDTIKHSWGYIYADEKNVEFHISCCDEVPNGFYWSGRGCCVWDAKAHGWQAFMEQLK